jgi:tRNA modification GTPase
MARADRILLVVDDAAPDPQALAQAAAHLPPGLPRTVIRNKIDLTGRAPALRAADGAAEVLLSAKTGAGLDLLCAHLKQCMGFQPAGEGTFTARRRHLEAIGRAQHHLAAAHDHARARAGELAAEELRQAQRALAEITGEFAPEDLLARIFSAFCIGK